jgi:hypothetical protein
MDCFVAEFIIGPAEGRTRWLLAMTFLPIEIVVTALDPAIHLLRKGLVRRLMDARIKSDQVRA